MDKLYYDLSKPGSLSGIRTLSRYSHNNVNDIKHFLSEQPAYTLHRPVRRKFVRRKTFSKGIGDLYQADIANMSRLANSNDGIRYLLTCIDVFSKMAWAVPLCTKGAREVSEAFEREIVGNNPPTLLQTNKGSEFVNGTFQQMLQKHGIRWYSSENSDIKAAVVERFNRTLKERIHQYFTYRNTNHYIDVLPELLRAYNDTWHRSIGMAPSEVGPHNAEMVVSIHRNPRNSIGNYGSVTL